MSGKPKYSQRMPEKTLRIRMTEEQRDALDQVAKRVNRPTSDWARMVLLNVAGVPIKTTVRKMLP